MMALTRAQRKLQKEAEAIAEIAKLDFWNIENVEQFGRIPALQVGIHRMAVGQIVTKYTLIDEVLSSMICSYFFKHPRNKAVTFQRRWRTKKFRIFVHYIIDEMYLLKKMELVHAISPIPKEVRQTIQKINALRNALAHSFFPENRKEYRKVKKVVFNGLDIKTAKGLEAFTHEMHEAWVYLAKRAWGITWNWEI